MSGCEKWYYTAEALANSPSIKFGMDADTELNYRQRAANLIQDMGQRIQVSQLCINTAIVYMHRFYVYHSFTHFHRNSMAAAALFLAAKVEEQPRKIEHIIKAQNACLNGGEMSKEKYSEQAQDLVLNENILLQTLGFDVAIDHPHTHVVKTMQLVRASKDLAQTSYFMASNSLHLTTMCLQYKPTVVAAFCIHLACQWSSWEIPTSSEGKRWFTYVDETITMDILRKLTDEFLYIFEKSNSRLKNKMNSVKTSSSGNSQHSSSSVDRPIKDETGQSSGHHKHHHNHHQTHNKDKDHRSHKQSTGDNKMNPQAASSGQQQRPPHHQQQQQQQQQAQGSSANSGMNMNAQRDRNHMKSNSGSSAGSYAGSMKVPGHDSSKRPTMQNIHPDSHNKNRHNYPGNQIPGGVPNSSGMQKHPDQRHSSKMPPSDLMKKQPKMYPNSANTQEYSSRPSSMPSNKLPNTGYPQSQSGSRNSSQSQSASVLLDTKIETPLKPSFSLIDESSDLMESLTQMPPKKAAPSIFDPDFNDSTDIQLKMKPNKDSPSKDKLRRDKQGADSRAPPKRPGLSMDNQMPSMSQGQMQKRSLLAPSTATSMPSNSTSEAQKQLYQQRRQEQQLQRQHSKQTLSQSLFNHNPPMKRPLDGVNTINESLSKKPKISNNFYEADFDKIYGSAMGKSDSNLFGPGQNSNSNHSFNSNNHSNQNSNDFTMMNDNSSSQTQSQFDIKKEFEVKKEFDVKKESLSSVSAKEANPDFVKSLLQESFSQNDSKLSLVNSDLLLNSITHIPSELPDDVLAEPITSQPSLPVSLSVPASVAVPLVSAPPLVPIKQENSTSLVDSSSISVPLINSEDNNGSGGDHHRKKEKKKKEKHKHKERSKDKEERKKHKKDKDREKDRHKHKEPFVENTPKIKIKGIPPSVPLPTDDQPPKSPLKIKLPVDKTLKITISKEKIKGYDGSSSSSHKKKDKDREKERSRDKDRERSKHSKMSIEHSKMNGTGSDHNNRFSNTINPQMQTTHSQPQTLTIPQQQQQQPQQLQSLDSFYDFGNMYNPSIGGQMNKMAQPESEGDTPYFMG